jgi:cell division protein FtsX
MKVAFFDPLRTKVVFVPWVGTKDVIATIPWLLVAGAVVAIVASLFAMRRFLDV